jgi:hypothetical protein
VVRPPTMAVLSRSLRGSLFRADRLPWFPRLLEGDDPNLTTSVPETAAGSESAQNSARELSVSTPDPAQQGVRARSDLLSRCGPFRQPRGGWANRYCI